MLLDHERSRLAALRQYDVLDTPPEDYFDRITAMTARLFNVDMTCITLVDKERFYFKSAFGADVTELERQPGFCDTTIQNEGIYCIEDTTSDPSVQNHPMVLNAPHVKFYAGSPLRTSDGFAIGTLCLLHPATRVFSATDRILLQEMSDFVMFQLDRRRLEAETERREEEIRNVQKLESLGVLAGGVAHDFNNLLVGVLGSASLADSQIDESSPAKDSLANIVRAANQGRELTDQLLSYAGQRPVSPRPFDLSKMLGDMSALIRSSIAKNATLELDCASDLPLVTGDSTQLRQVILNLITNASEAYEEKAGPITIRLSSILITASETENVHFGDLKPGEYVLLEVIDQGCGMDEDTLRSLFDPFYSTKPSGRGLGMSIVQRIVRGHAGLIQVESNLDQGCKVSVFLPAGAFDPVKDVVKLPVASNTWTGTGTVLVVDDEDLVVNITSSAIKHLGFDVISAPNGTKALELLNGESEFKALVLDATMPGMNGAATLDEVKKQWPELPTVITSGHHVDEVARQFPEFEKLTFLHKPWTFDDLASALREALSK